MVLVMLTDALFWDSLVFDGIDEVEVEAVAAAFGTAEAVARGRARGAVCPDCGRLSDRVHDRYQRRLKDLPLADQGFVIRLTVRRFHLRVGGVPAPDVRRAVLPADCPACTVHHAAQPRPGAGGAGLGGAGWRSSGGWLQQRGQHRRGPRDEHGHGGWGASEWGHVREWVKHSSATASSGDSGRTGDTGNSGNASNSSWTTGGDGARGGDSGATHTAGMNHAASKTDAHHTGGCGLLALTKAADHETFGLSARRSGHGKPSVAAVD
ncbi:transposase family protein, partial [Streptomyces mutabilis]|uniref:transposase family protein n=2 Tax=Streptomyces mutabilis TaxID=67332 RepID=UPI003680A8B5